MLTLQNLTNLVVFMRRATSNGEEAIAWCETMQAVTVEIQALQTPKPQPAPEALAAQVQTA